MILYYFPHTKQRRANVSYTRDINERKQIEESLRENEERYRMLFTNMSEAFFLAEIICDENGRPYDYRFLEINPAFEFHAGVKGEQVLGKSHLEVFLKEDPIVIEKYGEVALSGKPTYFDFFSQVTNRYIDIYVFSPENGKFAGVFRNITERKQLEEKTRQRVEEIETVMEVVPVAIWIGHDPQCHNITGNRMANELYEAQLGENVSASVTPMRRFFYKGCELTANELPMQQATLKDVDVRSEEIDVLLPSGEWRALLGSASPLHDADGHVRGSVGAFIDITKRKEAEVKLKETLDNLENLVNERTAELEKAYNSLKKSEASLAEAQKTAHIGNWDWDLVAGNIYWSDEMYRIFGLSPQEFEVNYNTFLNYVHPEDREYMNNAFNNALNGKNHGSIDYRIVLADGEERTVHGQGEVTFNEEHTPFRMIGTVQDITERKKAEERIRNLANIVESSNDAIITKSLEGIITGWNKGAEQIYGYSAEEILGKHVSTLMPFSSYEEAEELSEIIKNGGRVDHYETLRRRKDGKIIDISITLSPVFDMYGKLTAISVIARDVTERKRAEQALELSEERYRTFIQNFKGIAFQLDKYTNLEFMKGDVEEITGYTEEELIYKKLWKKIIEPEDLSLFFKEKREAENSGSIYAGELEYRIRCKDGNIKWMHETYQKISGRNGRPDKYQGVIYDITEKKNTEKAFLDAEITRKREIHHRIKNNLQVISSLLDLQADKFRNRNQAEDSEVLAAFIESQDRVLSIALIHEGLHEGKGTDKLNFCAYLEKLVENLFETYRVGDVELSLNMDLEENIFFDMDIAVPLGLIVNEIVSNSLKYAFSGRDKGTVVHQ